MHNKNRITKQVVEVLFFYLSNGGVPFLKKRRVSWRDASVHARGRVIVDCSGTWLGWRRIALLVGGGALLL